MRVLPFESGQLAALQAVMETVLLPAVAARDGLWAIGPVFAGSHVMPGDADLIAGGLLIELKTTGKKPSLGVTDLGQVLGYVLMDYADEFRRHRRGTVLPAVRVPGRMEP